MPLGECVGPVCSCGLRQMSTSTITPIHEKQWFRIALSKYGGTWGPTNSNINIKPFLALSRLMGL